MSAIVGMLIAILILTLCICLHELGHMAVAKACGVGVVEYSFGMGKLVWWKRKGDTVYSIRLFPLGGYCAMYGEQSMEAGDKGEADGGSGQAGQPDFKTDWKPEQALCAAKTWQKILIYIAGPGMNFVLGIIACVFLVGFGRFATVPVISEVMDGHPAALQDVQPGDIVAGINGRETLTWTDYEEYMACHPKEVEDGWELTLFRDGGTHTVHATRLEDDGLFGITVTQEPVELTPDLFALYTWDAASYMCRSVVDSLAMLARGDVSLSEMSGIVGITASMGSIVDEAVSEVDEYVDENRDEADERVGMIVNSVFTSAMFMMALISVNLGMMNLIPIPALDGGRVVLSLVEKAIRRPIPERVEYTINAVSMICLLVLMGYVCVNDIWKVLTGAFIAG